MVRYNLVEVQNMERDTILSKFHTKSRVFVALNHSDLPKEEMNYLIEGMVKTYEEILDEIDLFIVQRVF